jgi:hypothetical protein
MCALRRLRLQRLGIVALGILDLAPPLAIIGPEQVAQDREQPRRQVGSRLEGIDVGKRAQQRLLNQVIGTIAIAGKRDRKGAETRHRRQNIVTKGISERH